MPFRSIQHLLIPLCIVLLSCTVANAGGGPRKERQTYMHIGWQGFNASSWYNGSVRADVDRITDNTFSLYGEYGYTSRLTGMFRLPGYRMLSVRTQADAPLTSVQAPGDAELGLRYAAWMGEGAAFSFSLLASFPLGETSDSSGLWTGDGEYNQILALEYWRHFNAIPVFLNLSTGFNNRNAGYADELRVGAEIGYDGWRNVTLSALLFAVEHFGNGIAGFRGGGFGFAANHQRYLAYGPQVSIELIEGFGLNVAALAMTRTENAPATLLWRSGVYFRMERQRAGTKRD
jgi:hypothetical protein